MLGLTLELSGIFSFFRIPYNSLLMDTYLFPPKTTLIGIIGASIGWEEEEFLKTIKKTQYGLIIKNPGERISENAVIFKNKRTPVYPLTKNMNYKPAYKAFFTCEDDEIVKLAYKYLKNPNHVLSLGDSENLFYPKSPDYVKLFELKYVKVDKLTCLIPSSVYNEYVKGISPIYRDLIPPYEVRIPVDFEGRGKNRRSILKKVYCHHGFQLNLKNPLGVYKFGEDEVYLF